MLLTVNWMSESLEPLVIAAFDTIAHAHLSTHRADSRSTSIASACRLAYTASLRLALASPATWVAAVAMATLTLSWKSALLAREAWSRYVISSLYGQAPRNLWFQVATRMSDAPLLIAENTTREMVLATLEVALLA